MIVQDWPIRDTQRHMKVGGNYLRSLTDSAVFYWPDVSFVFRIPQLENKMATYVPTNYSLKYLMYKQDLALNNQQELIFFSFNQMT